MTRHLSINGVVVFLAATCLLTMPALAQSDWSSQVLSRRDVGEKEELVCVLGNREGVSAETLAKLIARERHSRAVAAAAGQYFEKAELTRDTPALLRALAERPDIGDQALAYAALSPSAPELIVGFASSGSTRDQRIAAQLLAMTAVMRTGADRTKQRPPANVNGPSARLNVDYGAQVVALLASRDAEVLVYALHAAGLDRVEQAKDAAAAYGSHREPAVAMAAQFALASVGEPVDAERILKQIAGAPPPQRRRRGAVTQTLTYDPAVSARGYAVMAAGRAGLDDAVAPLLGLLADDDLDTAVAAARALGEIGGEGMSTKLLGAMDADTTWPVRVAMYDALGANPDKDSIVPLRKRFDDEPGRLRQDALYALLSIAGGQVQGKTIEAFDDWWAQHGDAFEQDAEATAAWRAEHKVGQAEVEPIAGFYDSAVISDRPVFAVDASLSMRGAQIESLKQTLDEVVLSLPDRVKFNIVDFGGHVRVLAEGALIPAQNRRRAMEQFKYDMELTLGTRTFDAIERAMLIPEMDTVHFLSDGAPYGSQLASWNRINYVTRLLCRTTPVAVHIIFFPEPANAQQAANSPNAKRMQRYANSHAGRFVVSVAE